LECLQPLLELRHKLTQVAVAAGRVEILANLAPFPGELVGRLELFQAPPYLRRLAVVVVDGGIRHPFLRLAVGALELPDQVFHHAHTAKRTQSRGRPRAGPGVAPRPPRRSGTTFGGIRERLLDFHSSFAINSKYAIQTRERSDAMTDF